MFKELHYLYHEWINRDDLYQHYREAIQRQWDGDRVKIFQKNALRNILIHSITNVPYYKNLFQDHKLKLNNEFNLCDFNKVPILTKDIIRENFESLKARNISSNRFKKNSTGGSTGSNLIFYSDKAARIRQALEMRCNDWMGYKFGYRELKIWGAPFDVSRSKKIIPSIKSFFKSSMTLSGYKLSDKDFYQKFQVINRYKPYLLTSYPSILFSFAMYLEKNRFEVQVGAIKSSGEKLHEFQRKKIEHVFKAKVYDFYGGRDIPMIAMQCGHDKGLHILCENVLLEIVDEFGNIKQEGEGDLILTDLHNYVFPFIRYKIGDRGRISNKVCTCGRGLPLLDEVIGRTFEIIQFSNGNRVGGTFWTLVMRSVNGIKDFQVEEKMCDVIEIRYVPENESEKININKLSKIIKGYAGQDIQLHFKNVNQLEPTRSGKHMFVISKK